MPHDPRNLRVDREGMLPCPGEDCDGKVSVDIEQQYAVHFPATPCVWFRDSSGERIVEYVLGTQVN